MRYDNNDGSFFIIYLLLAVTIGGMKLWLGLIQISGAATASSYHLLNTFFGVLLAYLILRSLYAWRISLVQRLLQPD
ncbi:hypothetical protein [Vreelandella sp. H-I2]